MNERSKTISKLKESANFRASYLRAKLNVNIPSQIRALRRRRGLNQTALAKEATMLQSRISTMERPGEAKFNLETLIRLAAAFKVGLIVKFAPYNEVLGWENGFSQDAFDVTKIEDDAEFLNPGTAEEWRDRAAVALRTTSAPAHTIKPVIDFSNIKAHAASRFRQSLRGATATSRNEALLYEELPSFIPTEISIPTGAASHA